MIGVGLLLNESAPPSPAVLPENLQPAMVGLELVVLSIAPPEPWEMLPTKVQLMIEGELKSLLAIAAPLMAELLFVNTHCWITGEALSVLKMAVAVLLEKTQLRMIGLAKALVKNGSGGVVAENAIADGRTGAEVEDGDLARALQTKKPSSAPAEPAGGGAGGCFQQWDCLHCPAGW